VLVFIVVLRRRSACCAARRSSHAGGASSWRRPSPTHTATAAPRGSHCAFVVAQGDGARATCDRCGRARRITANAANAFAPATRRSPRD